jgi:site-specific DNA-methyltransferase (adenine-specific)
VGDTRTSYPRGVTEVTEKNWFEDYGITDPYYADKWRVIVKGDCRDVLPLIPGNSVDLLLTDPPYGISFMGKEWDTFNEVVEPQGAYQYKKGFKKLPRQNTIAMTEFFVSIWRECLRVLKDGAFAFVMCSPRADVMAKQINSLQEAGFKVGFTPIFWTYASGFPKAQNIGKAVDKRLGVEREIMGRSNRIVAKNPMATNYQGTPTFAETADGREASKWLTRPSSPQAKALDGSYAGFQPKPAVEVIIVAMKPLSEKTFVDQALKNRHGITWLDEGRIPYESENDKETAKPFGEITGGIQKFATGEQKQGLNLQANLSGRFPANLLVSDDVLNDGRITKSGYMEGKHIAPNSYGGFHTPTETTTYPDSGSFSRYFDLDAVARVKFPWIDDIANAYNNSYTFYELVASRLGRIQNKQGSHLSSYLYEQYCAQVQPVSYDSVLSPSKLNTYLLLDVPLILHRLDKLLECYASGDSLHTSLLANEVLDAHCLKALVSFLDDYQEGHRLYDALPDFVQGLSPEFLLLLSCVNDLYYPEDNDHLNTPYSFLLSSYSLSSIILQIAGEVKLNLDKLPKSVKKTFPFLIVPKASKSEKDKGLDGEEQKIFCAISGRRDMDKMEDWKVDNDVTARMVTSRKNVHPTVKPLKLMSYLITLGSCKGGVVLDPFGGSGTTALACGLINRRCLAFEIEEKYCEISANRCAADTVARIQRGEY